MLWIKAFHLIAMVAWFAGLFYLPRLFVYHVTAVDPASNERFKIMERRLFYGIMTPAGIVTVILGIWLMTYNPSYYMRSGWMHAKLGLVGLLIIFHLLCGKWLHAFKHNRNRHARNFYRLLNEFPTVILIGVVILAVVKPF